ncbi:unnamed protein product [Zymoseptoria tritici ST99CH_1E4]|uniref:Uncharacterized protein n=2 Tax=Zymoseptoria tritici TaxID=1047171 RepID=F9XS10_ZYMTI|nr:uncharacterized protein MYCGRDRAFT_98000 [Zymoseptoria tritici IPO323]EGP81962.1 hypothetical protein MYCGRDRAFT_98000 [Zymoseptoria tritici IPO323]SMR62598.1 unnamed protein product [Zymoseptoria tritici ST99CH_1E4]
MKNLGRRRRVTEPDIISYRLESDELRGPAAYHWFDKTIVFEAADLPSRMDIERFRTGTLLFALKNDVSSHDYSFLRDLDQPPSQSQRRISEPPQPSTPLLSSPHFLGGLKENAYLSGSARWNREVFPKQCFDCAQYYTES